MTLQRLHCFIVVLSSFWCFPGKCNADLALLRNISNSLPALTGYWPLSSQFSLRDGSNNTIDGVFVNKNATLINGPFGLAGTAFQTGTATSGANYFYITLTSNLFINANTPWTLGTYVNMYGSANAPIVEFNNGTATQAHWWQNGTDVSLFNAMTGLADSFACPGLLSNWQYVAIVYDPINNTCYWFCNETIIGSLNLNASTYPFTAAILTLGFRTQTAWPATASGAAFACMSFYRSALNATQLVQVKQMCPHYQAISCSGNCAGNTCRPNLAATNGYTCSSCLVGWASTDCTVPVCSPTCKNGATCSAPNICNCLPGYTSIDCSIPICDTPCQNGGTCALANYCSCTGNWWGPTCTSNSTDLAFLKSMSASLPPSTGYWPLTSQFSLRDASGNMIDGTFFNKNATLVPGPFGVVGGAFKTGSATSGANNFYITFTSDLFNTTSSWTLATFVNMNFITSGPIIEFNYNNNYTVAHMWENGVNRLFYNPVTGFSYTSFVCPGLQSSWQFVAIVYDQANNISRWFCNETIVGSMPSSTFPTMASLMTVGFRKRLGTDSASAASFACISFYRAALNATQLIQVKQMCPHYQGIICSSNCVNDTCRAYLTATNGYTCGSCLAGWTSTDCSVPFCSPNCQNGGTCSSPNVCTCAVGWTSSDCTVPICDITCQNGGTCVEPNTCSCVGNWSGPICTSNPNQLKTLANSLPAPIAYWPLTSQFSLRDASGNGLDGVFVNSSATLVPGPLGLPDTGFKIGNLTGASARYISYGPYNLLDVGNQSWTLSTFVNTNGKQGPFLEFFDGAFCKSHFWHIYAADNLLSHTSGGALNQTCPGLAANSWMFVSMSYDKANNLLYSSCNQTMSSYVTQSIAPRAGMYLLQGYWIQSNFSDTANPSSFTCTSLYPAALNQTQLLLLQQLCPLYQGISCSSNCANDSCRVSLNATKGFSCSSCVAGWTSSDCSIPVCSPPFSCSRSGTCSAPNVCSCLAGWTSIDCSIPMCTMPCQNGGTCSAPDYCSCVGKWWGPTCASNGTDLGLLRNLASSLPVATAYWPLTSQFSLRDASGSMIDGTFVNKTATLVNGPLGLAGGAFKTGSTTSGANMSYITFTSELFNTTSSWTIAGYVNMNWITYGPIIEFSNNSYFLAHIYITEADHLYYNPITTAYGNKGCPSLQNSWQFVAIVYDQANNMSIWFCNQTIVGTTIAGTFPMTSSILNVGYRKKSTGDVAAAGSFACISFHTTALNTTQLGQVKQMCPYYQAITCSNCANETCRPHLSATNGYSCSSCLPGWTSMDCTVPVCSQPCLNGGTCSAPNVCMCAVGWAPSDCAVPTCDTMCQNGGSCVAPNTCSCVGTWSGPICTSNPTQLKSLANSLPSPIAYWPLTGQLSLRDASGNGLDGVFVNSSATLLTGPFGLPDTAFRTGNQTGASARFIKYGPYDKLLDAGNQSWTLSTFVNTYGKVGPMLEYYDGTVPKSHLWHVYNMNNLYINTIFGGGVFNQTCPGLASGWLFVSVSFDKANVRLYHMCNETMSSNLSLPGTPPTAKYLLQGYRMKTSADSALPASFACTSLYPAALNQTQLLLLKQLCPLYQGISCSSNCANDSCRVNLNATKGFSCSSCVARWTSSDCSIPVCSTPCGNGGNCTAPDICTCTPLWSGLTCETAACYPRCANGGSCASNHTCICIGNWSGPSCMSNLNQLKLLVNSLPAPIAYWPLTKQFQLRDASGNGLDGVFVNSSATLVTGPFGLSDTGYLTGSLTGAAAKYMLYGPYNQLDAGNQSLTVSWFVNTNGRQGPLLQWSNGTMFRYHLWHTFGWNNLYAGYNQSCIGLASTYWMFVSMTYDKANNRTYSMCNQTMGTYVARSSSLPTAAYIVQGYRTQAPSSDYAVALSFACTSLYPAALNETQLLQLQQLCPLYQGISCSSNCANDSCRVDLTATEGFACSSCLAGWTGPDCNTPVCTPSCENDGTCSAQHTCTCEMGWNGTNCQLAICTLPCVNGGTCAAPDQCNCPPIWTGLTCETVACYPSCANGGTCLSNHTCICIGNWSGPSCMSNLNQLKTLAGSLPAPIAYWPLTKQLSLRDASGNALDGVFINSSATLVSGPVGLPNTGFKTGNLSGPSSQFIRYGPYDQLRNAGNESWTLSTFVNTEGKQGPMLEFSNSTTWRSHLWHHYGATNMYIGASSGSSFNQTCPGLAGSDWLFVSMSYDKSNNRMYSICNQTISSYKAQSGVPQTASYLLQGYRYSVSDTPVSVSFACTSLYPAALNETQLLQLQQLCPLYQGISCSNNCANDSCRVDLAEVNGFSCSSCVSGWTSSDCSIPVCSPSCQNGGTCSAQHTCTCAAGWNGTSCNSASCTQPCVNGGNCTAPEICTCSNLWTGLTCEIAACYPSCANGGSCIANHTCVCNGNWTGPYCATTLDVSLLKALASSLPAPIGYWPHTRQFSLRDASGNGLDGTFCNATATSVTGPFSVPDTAFKTNGLTGPSAAYIKYGPYNLLNVGSQSWTLSAFVNANGSIGPILEYSNGTAPKAHFWQWQANRLWVNPGGGGSTSNSSCPGLNSLWTFISISYDKENNLTYTMCNQTMSANASQTIPVLTGNYLLEGYRISAPHLATATAFACTSLYPAAFNESQLLLLQQMCPLYQGIACSNNCVNDTCRANLNATNGFTCGECAAGWTSSDCTIPVCNQSCANGGSCSVPNTCSCSTGWNGTACSIPTCSSGCTHGGTCISANTCSCPNGWDGPSCSNPICCTACENGGTCTAPDTCSCAIGYNDTFCTNAICNQSCLNGGSCTAPDQCTCPPTWTGVTCETAICNAGCANGGTCTAPDICNCTSGFNGTTCSNPICLSTCANGGICTAPNTCSCTSGWNGTTCSNPICSSVCGNGGTCTAPNVCACLAEWTGLSCDIPICAPDCGTHGNCTYHSPTNNCTCEIGWEGDVTCSTPICSSPCVNGNCTTPNVCTCQVGWSGPTCDTPICSSCNWGNCTGADVCTCNIGWTGLTCNVAICSNPCLNGGNCTSPDICTCPTQSWIGETCETPVCFPICSNGGTCSAPNSCTCQTGWTGPNCMSAVCTLSCLNGGNCTAPNTCTCPAQKWNGTICESAVCSWACLHGGTCTQPNVCTCAQGWTGSNCYEPTCSPKCGAGGQCTLPNTCTCLPGWTGTLCNYGICSDPCLNNGTCSSPDTCTCVVGFSGVRCENSTEIFNSSSILAMTDKMLADNVVVVGEALTKLAAIVASNVTTDSVVGLISTMEQVMNRLGSSTTLEPEQFTNFAQECSAAVDAMMTSATNGTQIEEESQVPDDLSSVKCSLESIQQGSLSETIPSNTVQQNGLPSKDQLQKMYTSFLSMVVNMFAKLRSKLRPGTNMTFNGKFYSATVFNVQFGDLPGLKLDTNLAGVSFPSDVNSPSDLIGRLPTKCDKLNSSSIVPFVLSAFVVNVMDIDEPFNMPTVTVKLFCQQEAEIPANPNKPIRITAVPSVRKALLFSTQKIDAQCDISQIKCDLSNNVDKLGSLVTFPLTLSAGDFVIIFPSIDFNYSAYIALGSVPSAASYHWVATIDKSRSRAILMTGNDTSLETPRYYLNQQNGELRVIILTSAITQLFGSQPTTKKLLFVFMKKDISEFTSLADLPPSACQLQRSYGYHLRIGPAADNSIVNNNQRKRRSTNLANDTSYDEGFILEPESTESSVVFKSSYFGDFGADLVIAPNTIEFSEIFANFSQLIAENAAVLAFMIAAIDFFFVGVIFAFLFDRADLKEWAFLPLTSNKRHYRNKYLVSIHYSEVRNFKEGPKIQLRLFGSAFDTTWRLLDDGVRPQNFNGKHPGNFILTTQLSLGQIDAIELWVDSLSHQKGNASPKFSIHIDRVVIIDAEKGLKYVFLAKSTLGVDDHVKVDLASEDEMKGYTYLISGHSRTSFTDIHPWISVAQRPLPSNWTRCERLACVVAAVFMAMLVNAMFYGKEATTPNVGIRIGNFFTLSWFTVWTSFIGCVIVIPPTAVIAFIFKKVKRRTAERSHWATIFNIKLESETSKDEKPPKKPFQLPFHCVIIAWFLVAACVGLSAFFVVMYSLTWGREKSLQWLSGMVISVVQDIILIQPIKTVLSAIVSATVHNLPNDGLDLGKLTYNRNNDGHKVELFKRLRGLLVGIFHHAIYAVIFAVVIGTTTNPHAYNQMLSLKPLVLVPRVAPVTGILDDPSNVHYYMTTSLLPYFLSGNQLEFGGIFETPDRLYNCQNPNVAILGPIRIRQQRVSQTLCPISTELGHLLVGKYDSFLRFNSSLCQREFSNTLGIGGSSERRLFDGSWNLEMQGSFDTRNPNISTDAAPWIYRDTDGPPYSGWEANYKTGGYYVDLPRTLTEAVAVVEQLKSQRWFDNATSVVFIEFNLFNAQTNLFIPVKIVFESLSAGGMTYHARLFPLQLYQYSGASSMMVFVVQGIWLLLLISHAIKLIRTIKKYGFKRFFQDGWNVLDAVQILFGFGLVGLFAARIYVIINTVTTIQTARLKYVNLDLLANWEDLIFCLLGVQFFMVMMLFFRHLSVNKHWAILVATLSKGKRHLLSYGMVFGMATIMFAGFANLVMGNQSQNFSTMNRSILSLVQAIIGTINFASIDFSRFYLFLAVLYNIIVIFIGGNVFVTLILAAYNDVAIDVEHQTSWDSDLSNFVSTGFKELLKPTKKGPRVFKVNYGLSQNTESNDDIFENLPYEKVRGFYSGQLDRHWPPTSTQAGNLEPVPLWSLGHDGNF